MIKINNQSVQAMFINGRSVFAVYTNGKLVWPDSVITGDSCFASGYWIDLNPWTDDTAWTD